MKRIGVDTGGTFTDSVIWDEDKGLVGSAKTSSNKADPAGAVLAAITKLDDAVGTEVRYLIHGTTVATNATLERSGPRIGMLCTAGFRDVLEIARLTRPPEEIYDLRAAAQPPLIRRRDRLEIVERIDVDGEVVTPIDESSVIEAARVLARRGIKSVAVCLLQAAQVTADDRREIGVERRRARPLVFTELGQHLAGDRDAGARHFARKDVTYRFLVRAVDIRVQQAHRDAIDATARQQARRLNHR